MSGQVRAGDARRSRRRSADRHGSTRLPPRRRLTLPRDGRGDPPQLNGGSRLGLRRAPPGGKLDRGGDLVVLARPNCARAAPSAGNRDTHRLLPGAKKAMVGMLRMLKLRERPGLASTSTLTCRSSFVLLGELFHLGGDELAGSAPAARSRRRPLVVMEDTSSKGGVGGGLDRIGEVPFSRCGRRWRWPSGRSTGGADRPRGPVGR